MKKQFILFRHGQTDWNLERRCQGHTNIPLNKTGHSQAQALGQFLANEPLEVIFSSDLDRALETASYVAKSNNLKPAIMQSSDLREGHLGEAEGMKIAEIKEKFGEERWNSFRYQTGHWLELGFPGGESRRESLQRVKNFVESLVERPENNIALSTHGGVLRSLLHSFLPENHAPLDIPNCVVYKLIYNQGLWSVEGPLNLEIKNA